MLDVINRPQKPVPKLRIGHDSIGLISLSDGDGNLLMGKRRLYPLDEGLVELIGVHMKGRRHNGDRSVCLVNSKTGGAGAGLLTWPVRRDCRETPSSPGGESRSPKLRFALSSFHAPGRTSTAATRITRG